VTLQAFQEALSDLVASPKLCRRIRLNPKYALDRYELSAREWQRIVAVIQQPGMATNCTLYRANRIEPVYMLFPHTCFVLGDNLKREMDLFWESNEIEDLQFKQESDRFVAFLRRRIQSGEIVDGLLEQVLNFEVAINDLRFLSRRETQHELNHEHSLREALTLRLHPFVRIIPFQYEPLNLLRYLTDLRPLPYDLPQGEYYVLLDATSGDLHIKRSDLLLGRILYALDTNTITMLSTDDAETLIEARLAIYAPAVDKAR
jgi:hypothetical protein